MGLPSRLVAAQRKLFWLLALAIFALDQSTKLLLWQHPSAGRPDVILIPHVLRLISHAGNVKGALGLGPSGPFFYIVAAIVGLAAVVAFFLTADPNRALTHVALGMLAGGALGNMLDRVMLGSVRDFVDLHWGEAFHWHTFNVADAAICIGFALVVFDSFFARSREDKAAGRPAVTART